jgi:hypothetical protein
MRITHAWLVVIVLAGAGLPTDTATGMAGPKLLLGFIQH